MVRNAPTNERRHLEIKPLEYKPLKGLYNLRKVARVNIESPFSARRTVYVGNAVARALAAAPRTFSESARGLYARERFAARVGEAAH